MNSTPGAGETETGLKRRNSRKGHDKVATVFRHGSSQKITASGHKILKSGKPEFEPCDQELVAFGQVETLCYENDSTVTLQVVRRGSGKGTVSFDWATENVTVPLMSYKAQSGHIELADGQMSTSFELEVVDNPTWNVEGTQYVHMQNPSSNAVFGELSTATVVCLDDDMFPFNVTDSEDKLAMIIGFIRQLWSSFPKEARLGFCMKMYPAVGWLVAQFLIIVALNSTIPDGIAANAANNDSDLQAAYVNLYAWAFFYAVSIGVWYLCTEVFKRQRLGGKAKALLRWSALSIMLRLEAHNYGKFSTGEVITIMGQGVELAVNAVWLNIFVVAESFFQLLAMVGLTAYLAFRGDAAISRTFLVFPFFMAAIDFFLLYLRAPKQADRYQTYMDEEDKWKEKVVTYAELRQVIAAYRMGNVCGDIFKETHKTCNGTLYEATHTQVQTDWLARASHSLVAIVAFILAGRLAIAGDIKVGDFVGLMGTIFKFDTQMRALFSALSEMASGYASIAKMSALLNCKTRRNALLAAKLRRERLVKEHIEEDFQDDDDAFSPSNITIFEAVAEYDGTTRIGPLSMTIEPGQVIAVTGNGTSGKNSLLKLIARIMLPVEGFLYYPDNLRVRYLSDKPMLFTRSLMFNLTFGSRKPHPEEDIWALCRALGLSNSLMGNGDYEVGIAGERMSLSNRIIVCIVRALLSSVDIILLANTLDLLSLPQASTIVTLLHNLVESRGLSILSQDLKVPISLRKPKNVFYITRNKQIEELAAVTLSCDPSFLHEAEAEPLLKPEKRLEVSDSGIGYGQQSTKQNSAVVCPDPETVEDGDSPPSAPSSLLPPSPLSSPNHCSSTDQRLLLPPIPSAKVAPAPPEAHQIREQEHEPGKEYFDKPLLNDNA